MKKAIGVVVGVVVLVAVGVVLLAPPFERTPPQIEVPPEGSYIGAKAFLLIEVEDRPAGVGEVSIALLQRGRAWTLYSQSFPAKAHRVWVPLSFEPRRMGMGEGVATLKVMARDRSLWRFGRGNIAVAEVRLQVDYTPPRTEVLGNTRYIYFNGAGAALFRTGPDAVEAGVRVGRHLFTAYRKDRGGGLWAVLFGVTGEAGSREALLVAKDRAGNVRKLPLAFRLLRRKVVRERVYLTDAFIKEKVYPLLPPEKGDLPPEEAFRLVNEGMRPSDNAAIARIASRCSPTPLWEGAFLQLPNSQVTATFGEHRTYFYRGKRVGESVHLGYDLASVANAPVPAANRGRVLYTGSVGIYGNVVILDHGLGLATLYAHLSRWTVEEGQEVEKGQIIGYTGSTGLAGGDHLHFAVLLSGHPVDPVEWWDPKWLKERVLGVLEGYLAGG